MTGDPGGAPANTPENPPVPTPPPDGSIERELGITPKLCPRCGTSNLPTSKFCYKCGSPLPEAPLPDKKICRGCHAVNPGSATFCYRCGLRLPETASFGPEAVVTVGFWPRLAAGIIDWFFINIASNVVAAVVLFIISTIDPSFEQSFSVSEIFFSSTLPDWYWYMALGIMAFWALYWTVAVGWTGRTVGKLMLGIKVVGEDGGRVGFPRAFARFLSYFLCWATFGIGFLVIAMNSRHRGLHDFICGTMVIKV